MGEGPTQKNTDNDIPSIYSSKSGKTNLREDMKVVSEVLAMIQVLPTRMSAILIKLYTYDLCSFLHEHYTLNKNYFKYQRKHMLPLLDPRSCTSRTLS